MQHRKDLDGLRGIACLSVLALHIVIGPIKTSDTSWFFSLRSAIQPFLVGGVDLFFVLSGFLIVGILLDNKDADNYFSTFWRRRIGRIFPVYYLMFCIVLALYAIDAAYPSGLTRTLLFNQFPAWTYITFTQNFYTIATGIGGNFLGVTWSLAMEEQFYLILPFAVFFLSRNVFAFIVAALIVLTPFIRTVIWDLYGWRASYHLSPARMDTVLWGALIAYTVRRADWLDALSKLTMVINILILSLAALVAADCFGRLSSAIPPQDNYAILFASTLRYSALAMMYGLIILRLFLPGAKGLKSALSNPLLMKVGLLSYAAYMYHQIFNVTAHYLTHGSSPVLATWNHAWLPVLVFALTFTAAALSYRFMERPVQEWSRKVKYIKKDYSAVAVA